MGKKLAGYIRVSAVNGRGGDSFRSPEDQAAEIESWAKANGHTVEMLPPELDAKGSNAARPTFRRAVEAVKAGEYDGVVVAYLSRAGRDLRLMLDLRDEINAAGGVVYSARENLDSSSSAGRLQWNLLASIDQHYLEERREGFDRSRRGAVERGIWGPRVPRGYDRGPDRRLIPNDEADLIRDTFKRFSSGTSIGALARDLKMTAPGVRKLLKNRAYLGEVRQGEYLTTNAHPAIVDVRTFEAAQAKFDSGVRPGRNDNGPALLAGLVRCASCGYAMTRGSGGVYGGKRYSYYKCHVHHGGGTCPEPANIQEAALDEYIAKMIAPELKRLRVEARSGDRVARAQAALDEAESELAAFLETFSDTVDPAMLKRQAAKLQRAVDDARRNLRREAERAPAIPNDWVELTKPQQNALLRSLLTAVAVRPVGKGYRVPVEDRVQLIASTVDLELPKPGNGNGVGIRPLWLDGDAVGSV